MNILKKLTVVIWMDWIIVNKIVEMLNKIILINTIAHNPTINIMDGLLLQIILDGRMPKIIIITLMGGATLRMVFH